MPAQLMALNDGPSILLDKPILLLGRDLECDIRLDSRKISRRHCCLAQVGEHLVIRDLGSTNGIRINGVRVMEGHLAAGDELTIGNYRYRVNWEAASRLAGASKEKRKRGVDGVRSPEDDILESCEEPVALAEPLDGPAAAPIGHALPASEPLLEPADGVPPSGPKHPPIIPESLELAPNSDSLKGMPGSAAADADQRFPPPSTDNGDSRHLLDT